MPDPAAVAVMTRQYQEYRKVYPALRAIGRG
jgi:hypothetical protein